MFKLVVLSLFAAAVASAGAVISPLTLSYTSVVSPVTTISHQASSVIHPSPLIYSGLSYAHLIKKRSAPLAVNFFTPSYVASWRTYPAIPAAPITYTSPLFRTAPVLTTHLIKKRSASLLVPSTYIPYPHLPVVSTYRSPIFPSIISHNPIAYTHLIKKRAIAFPVITPASYSHSSRVDYHSSPAISYTSYSAPLTYASPVLTHLTY